MLLPSIIVISNATACSGMQLSEGGEGCRMESSKAQMTYGLDEIIKSLNLKEGLGANEGDRSQRVQMTYLVRTISLCVADTSAESHWASGRRFR
jgi:hypothetical protein